MSGLADTLLARSRGSVAVSGQPSPTRGAIEPRLPARYEASGDRLESLEAEATHPSEPVFANQPMVIREPLAASFRPASDTSEAGELPSPQSTYSATGNEIRHTLHEHEVRQIVVERANADRPVVSHERPAESYRASRKRSQTAEAIQPVQVQANRESATTSREVASNLPRTELRKSDDVSPVRPVEPKTDAIDAAIKSAIDSAMTPEMKSTVNSWVESKLNSRLDGERAMDAGRTRRERSQLESIAKPPTVAEPVIEIHIGRIEIRAANPQPAPTRRAQRQPISLEEYGRQRKGETR